MKIFSRLARALALFAIAFAAPAHAADWWEAETAHFIIKSRDNRDEVEKFARDLERFDGVLRQLQGLPLDHEEQSRANKLTVYRFGDEKDVARVAGYPGSGIAGIFYPRAGQSISLVPVKRSNPRDMRASARNRQTELEPLVVLRHEYTHYFMMQHFPGAYPRWYTEGFAETLGTTRINSDGSAHIGDPPQHRAYQIFQMNDFRLAKMLDAEHRLSGADAIQHYATGWLMTHYLSFDFNGPRKGQLLSYLKALADGEESLTAANRIFGDLRVLEKELEKYKKGRFPGLDVSMHSEQRTDVAMRQLSDAEEALVFHEIDVFRTPGKKESLKVAKALEGVLTREPGNLPARALLAQAQLNARDYVGADATAKALVEADPKHAIGWMARAVAAAERAKTDVSQAALAREYATKAADLNPHDPRAYIAYYYSYVTSKETPPEAAAFALEKPFKQAGTDVGYRLMLARQLLLENRIDAARAVLIPVAFSGHKTGNPDEDEETPTLDKLLDTITAKDRDGALAMIQKMFDEADKDDEA